MPTWRIPIDKNLPLLHPGQELLPGIASLARVIRAKADRTPGQQQWLDDFDKIYHATRGPNPELQSSFARELSGQATIPPPRRPSPPERQEFSGAPTMEAPKRAPTPPPPPPVDAEAPEDDEIEDPFEGGMRPPPSSLASTRPPRQLDEDGEEEDSPQLMIDAAHMDAIIARIDQLSGHVVNAMTEHTRLARQSVEDARKTMGEVNTQAMRMASAAIENANKLNEASLNTMNSLGDFSKNILSSMDSRMRAAEEARLASQEALSEAFVREAQARASIETGVEQTGSPLDEEKESVVAKIVGQALATNAGGIIEGIMKLFNRGGGVTKDEVAAAVAEGVAKATAKAQ